MFVFILVGMLAHARPAHAQASGLSVPIDTGFDFNSIQKHLKDFILDGLATTLARMILQQMTTSVVNWINSGFHGSPSFVTDPKGFFLDVGDQVTGAFLSKYGGPLTQLCSPFSYDIRVALALDRVQTSQSRYKCTLSSIINNSANAVKTATVNGKSINGFMKGDFSQGGWPAFITMTTQPQNNIYGAYLQADSDLQARISAKQTTINLDLTRGGGFMSFPSCKTLLTVDPTDQDQVDEAEGLTAGDTRVSTKNNSDGTVTYETCTTETPGSVISSSLNKQLGAPVDQLNLTNQINQVISALFAQLVTTVLNGGLHSYSNTSAANNNSFTSYIPNDLPGSSDFDKQKQAAVSALSTYGQNTQQYLGNYTQADQALSSGKDALIAARICFSTKLDESTSSSQYIDRTLVQNGIDSINSFLSAKVDPAITANQSKLTDAKSRQEAVNAYSKDIQNIQSFQGISDVTDAINSSKITTVADVQASQADLDSAKSLATEFKTKADVYQTECAGTVTN